jgi:LCP family protein required for cell wall assembly
MPTHRNRLAVAVTFVYIGTVLLLAGFVGIQLHDWARTRILDMSVLALVEAMGEVTHSVAPAGVPDQPAQTDVAGTPGEAPVVAQAPIPSQPINILVMGTDARPDEQGPPLTDTLILLSLDPATRTAGMLSLPRDLWVHMPGVDVTTKINTAYRLGESSGYTGGGPQLVKDTVSSLIGQPVPYYVRVSFDGFVELVDLIGGVDVVLPTTIHDDKYPTVDYGYEVFHLDAGTQHLDGETALKYVRTRNIDSDYGRARRQQQVIRAVADKVLRADMLPTVLARAPRLLYTMRSSIDTDLPMATQLELANFARDNSLNEIRQLVLDSRFGEETYSEEGAWILVPDRTRMRTALDAFFSPGEAGDATALSATTSDWVRVEVLNGTGEPGVAARTRDLLQAKGWQVISIGDADRGDYDHTLIVNYGVPDAMVSKVTSDLRLQPGVSSLNGMNPAIPVDMRIVVGKDILDSLQ